MQTCHGKAKESGCKTAPAHLVNPKEGRQAHQADQGGVKGEPHHIQLLAAGQGDQCSRGTGKLSRACTLERQKWRQAAHGSAIICYYMLTQHPPTARTSTRPHLSSLPLNVIMAPLQMVAAMENAIA